MDFWVVPSFDPLDQVALPDGHLAPRRITAQAKGPGLPYDVELDLDVGPTGRYEVASVRAMRKRSKDGKRLGPEVTTEGLRKIPVKAILREGTKDLEGVGDLLALVTDAPPGLFRRVNDEALARVATIYRRAVALGQPPTKAVGDVLGMPRSTASRWISQARERGFLGAATPAKAGERPKRKG